MSIFKERLKQCRMKKSLTQSQVASDFGILLRSYQKYEGGEREPDIDRLIALADYFDVSTDFLLGRTDNPNSHKR